MGCLLEVSGRHRVWVRHTTEDGSDLSAASCLPTPLTASFSSRQALLEHTGPWEHPWYTTCHGTKPHPEECKLCGCTPPGLFKR